MSSAPPASGIESPYAWCRLAAAVLLMAIGSAGMYTATVVLPQVQLEFGISRSAASLPYTATMVAFAIGGLFMGRWVDRFGILPPVVVGAFFLGAGFIAAGLAQNMTQFILAHGLLIGLLGSSATFGPLVADISHWFTRRRGVAVAICVSGNYVGGAFWPPVMQTFFDLYGWRTTYIGAGFGCVVAVLTLSLLLRRPSPIGHTGENAAAQPVTEYSDRPLGLPKNVLQALIVVAAVSCCVAMSMPQVHIVAYCGDLGFGAARGAQMLALMLGAGIISRLIAGIVADRIGGLRTLLYSAILQGIALAFFLPFESLTSLYVNSILFGLFQGGIVPMYALIVRDYFPAKEAGARVSMAFTATMLGMALGGWLSGVIFDFTGSYRAAFIHGIGWNALNIVIGLELLRRLRRAAPRRKMMATS